MLPKEFYDIFMEHWISDSGIKNQILVNLFLILTVIGLVAQMTGKVLQAMGLVLGLH